MQDIMDLKQESKRKSKRNKNSTYDKFFVSAIFVPLAFHSTSTNKNKKKKINEKRKIGVLYTGN